MAAVSRDKITSSVAGDRGGTGDKQHFLAFYFILFYYSSLLLHRTAALNALSLNTGSIWPAGGKQCKTE